MQINLCFERDSMQDLEELKLYLSSKEMYQALKNAKSFIHHRLRIPTENRQIKEDVFLEQLLDLLEFDGTTN